MSARTAWEIAALEDVRLAPSPRQQQPAPAPCVRPASASPLPGPAEDPGAADREVLTRGWGRFSSALGCSVAYRPSPPPLAGHRWAGAWVSLVPPCSHPWPWGISGRSWGVHPAARSRPICLSRGKLGRPLPVAGAGDAPPGPRLPQSPPGRGARRGARTTLRPVLG